MVLGAALQQCIVQALRQKVFYTRKVVLYLTQDTITILKGTSVHHEMIKLRSDLGHIFKSKLNRIFAHSNGTLTYSTVVRN